MDMQQQGKLFTRLVGLELKGRIVARGFTAQDVATATNHSPAAFNRWLNGKVELPLRVLCEACAVINVTPSEITDAAFERLQTEIRITAAAPAQAPAPAPVEVVPDWTQLAAHQPGYSFKDELAERMDTP